MSDQEMTLVELQAAVTVAQAVYQADLNALSVSPNDPTLLWNAYQAQTNYNNLYTALQQDGGTTGGQDQNQQQNQQQNSGTSITGVLGSLSGVAGLAGLGKSIMGTPANQAQQVAIINQQMLNRESALYPNDTPAQLMNEQYSLNGQSYYIDPNTGQWTTNAYSNVFNPDTGEFGLVNNQIATVQDASTINQNIGLADQASAAQGSGGIMSSLSGGLFGQIASAGAAAGATFADVSAVEAEVANPTVVGGLKVAASTAALFGTLWWMAKTFSSRIQVLKHFMDTAPTWEKVAIFMAIASLVTVVTAIVAKMNEKSVTPAGAAAQTFNIATAAASNWFENVPSGAVMMLAAGTSLATLGISISPNAVSQTLSMTPMQLQQLSATVTAAGDTVPASGLYGIPIVDPTTDASGNTVDKVIIVSPPDSSGNSTVQVMTVSSDGYLIGPNGPATSYSPMFFPKLDSKGNVVGVVQNDNAVNAIYKQMAGLSMANNTSLPAGTRQGGLNMANTANHTVQTVPTGSH